jgi:hypothetical protein
MSVIPAEISANAIDPTRCPLCGQSNRCAMELAQETGRPQPPCWCTKVDLASELLARVPTALQGQACICPGCAARTGPGR